MEQVEAGQSSYILILLKLRQTNGALVSLLFLLLRFSTFWSSWSLAELVWQGVPLYTGPAGTSVHAAIDSPCLYESHILLKVIIES